MLKPIKDGHPHFLRFPINHLKNISHSTIKQVRKSHVASVFG